MNNLHNHLLKLNRKNIDICKDARKLYRISKNYVYFLATFYGAYLGFLLYLSFSRMVGWWICISAIFICTTFPISLYLAETTQTIRAWGVANTEEFVITQTALPIISTFIDMVMGANETDSFYTESQEQIILSFYDEIKMINSGILDLLKNDKFFITLCVPNTLTKNIKSYVYYYANIKPKVDKKYNKNLSAMSNSHNDMLMYDTIFAMGFAIMGLILHSTIFFGMYMIIYTIFIYHSVYCSSVVKAIDRVYGNKEEFKEFFSNVTQFNMLACANRSVIEEIENDISPEAFDMCYTMYIETLMDRLNDKNANCDMSSKMM